MQRTIVLAFVVIASGACTPDLSPVQQTASNQATIESGIPDDGAGKIGLSAASDVPASHGIPTSSAEVPAPPTSPERQFHLSQAQITSGATSTMLIRRGHATIEVDSLDSGIARVRDLAVRTGAVVANTTVHAGREQRRSASLELRVPSERFDAVLNALGPIGKVESVNVTADDVGDEYVDLVARLANARRLEERLIRLLAERTGRLADVLSVERELGRVREEIERYEGRMRYLQARIAVSSMTIVVQEPPPLVASRPGENIIAEAFVMAWRGFVYLVAGVIASLGIVIPVAALVAGVLVLRKRHLARRPLPAPQS